MNYKGFMKSLIDTVPDEKTTLLPSEFAEQNRYLPRSVTPKPGYFSFDVAPYTREIVDSMDVDSDMEIGAVLKGSQVCMTVSVLENVILYVIGEVKTLPMMTITTDDSLAKLRMEVNVMPAIQQSRMGHLIQSNDQTNNHKAGATAKKVEWVGGGWLVPVGARSPAKFRSISVPILLLDEPDSFPLELGSEGDTVDLMMSRTKSFEATRKVMLMSTPTEKETSRIARYYEDGDKRKYMMPCRFCGKLVDFEFQGKLDNGGRSYGLIWEYSDPDEMTRVKPGSVRFVCKHCGGKHLNSDKAFMLPAGKWVATAKPKYPGYRSWHVPAMLSPIGMYTWEKMVMAYLKGWDPKTEAIRDEPSLRYFYNHDLGLPYETRGSQILYEAVSAHKRDCYLYGQIPNEWLTEHAGSRVGIVNCAVDVHGDRLHVSTWGWTDGCRPVLLDRMEMLGSTEDVDNDVWEELYEIITDKVYIADDGFEYNIALTAIDCGYESEVVHSFCAKFDQNVYAFKGVSVTAKAAKLKEFNEYETKLGASAYAINVDHYKARWAASLKREWSGFGVMPRRQLSLPRDATKKQIKELNAEEKRPKKRASDGKRVGWEWYRPSGAANELWDMLIYSNALLEIEAYRVCTYHLGLEAVEWDKFWEFILRNSLYFR